MNEKLISGYAAYTTADELGTAANGDAPASVETVTVGITIASVGLSASTVTSKC